MWRDLTRATLLRLPGPQQRYRAAWAPLEQIVADACALQDHYRPVAEGIRYDAGGTVPYYPFLAGLAHVINAQRVLEIGTLHGGSALALAAGMDGGTVVTFDVEPHGAETLAGHPQIRAFTADATSRDGLDLARAALGDDPIDLALVDGEHDYWETQRSWMVCEWLGARIVVIDDIDLDDEMRRFWTDLQQPHRTTVEAVAVADVDPTVRPEFGMGVVRLPRPRFQ